MEMAIHTGAYQGLPRVASTMVCRRSWSIPEGALAVGELPACILDLVVPRIPLVGHLTKKKLRCERTVEWLSVIAII